MYADEKWYKKYELAKSYYEYYGNLEVKYKFKTKNGYDYDDDGFALGAWVTRYRQAFRGNGNCKINDHQIELLEDIGMRFYEDSNYEKWFDRYRLAKIYYNHYGNLSMEDDFKTVNGYEYDENGFSLQRWLKRQKAKFSGKIYGKLDNKQISLLRKIGFNFNDRDYDKIWYDRYNVAKSFYEKFHHLNVPKHFKTVNGYELSDDGFELDSWVIRQKQAYKGLLNNKLTSNQIKLLEDIGIVWFQDKIDKKLQSQEIIDGRKKLIELLNRTYSLINTYSSNYLPSKDEINKEMIDSLNHKSK